MAHLAHCAKCATLRAKQSKGLHVAQVALCAIAGKVCHKIRSHSNGRISLST